MSKSLAVFRSKALSRQHGRCYYCELFMWSGDPVAFASKHGLTLRQVKRLQCTGEHLQARQDGGKNSEANIVAACRACNQGRHRKKKAPPPDQYRLFIQRRIEQGRWHDVQIINRLRS